MDAAVAMIAKSSLKKNLPQFKVGQTVRIHQRIKEGGKERIQVFEGLIIKVNNGNGINGSITVRKIVDGVGVEKLYAIHSPNIAKIELTKEAKIRRGKLYYMRERTGKAARLKTKLLEGQIFEPSPLHESSEAAKPEESVKEEEVKSEEVPSKGGSASGGKEETISEDQEEPPAEEAKEE